MKKVLVTIFVLLLVALLIPVGVFAQEEPTTTTDDYKTSQTYQDLQQFVTSFPNRSGTANEQRVAEYIVTKFQSFGYESAIQDVPFEKYNYQTCNAIGKKDNPDTTDCIVIGAHYDSVGEGANDNASGVVALLQIAEKLKNATLPFDVYFVGFGGEEQGLYGSQYFVSQFSIEYRIPLNSIRVMFNVDSIANGDKLYLQCENKSTNLQKFILQNASGKSALKHKPYAVGVFNIDVWGYGYYETVQGSDHTPFRVEGVPVASFFSGNFKNWDYVESTNSKNNTMNTGMDKLETCRQSWIDNVDTVVATVVATVTNSQFDEISINAQKQLVNLKLWYSSLVPRIVTVVVAIVLAILAVLHNRKLQKQAIMGTAQVKTNRIFETPSADDIFTFKD